METQTTLVTSPFSDRFLSQFLDVTARIFGNDASQDWFDSLKWRLEKMPDITVFAAKSDDRIVGFKAGYAATYNRYYSWLGGVVPDFQKRGIAKNLMDEQHNWLYASRFKIVETHVEQSNKAMIQLNMRCGLAITGSFMKRDKPNFIMQKNTKKQES